MRARRNKQEPNYWAAYADCMLALFMIALLLWLLSTGKTIFSSGDSKGTVVDDPEKVIAELKKKSKKKDEQITELRKVIEASPNAERLQELIKNNDELKNKIREVRMQLENALTDTVRLAKQNEDLSAQNSRLERDLKDLKKRLGDLKGQLNDKPPIIRIDEEREDYRFPSGSSVISSKFSEGLWGDEFERLAAEIIKRHYFEGGKVDTLEIIGHTDGVPISGTGNLDSRLPSVLAGKTSLGDKLRPGSNNDLGLLRALAVREEWVKYVSKRVEAEILSQITIRCYSAGQTILPSNGIAISPSDFLKSDPKARRIEMRLTGLKRD